MIAKGVVLLYLFLIPFNVFSQSGIVTVKFCPLALTDEISFPTIQGGLEFRLSEKLAWYNEAGIKYRNTEYEGADTSHVKSSGFKLKTEFRYYIRKKSDSDNSENSKKPERYLAANLFYTKGSHNIDFAYFPNQDTSQYRIDNLGVRKEVLGFNILAGMQLHFPGIRNLLFDVYAGPGIRFSYIDNVNQEYDPDRDEMDHPVDVNIMAIKKSYDTDQGLRTRFNLTGGFRLCYRF